MQFSLTIFPLKLQYFLARLHHEDLDIVTGKYFS